MSYWIMRVLLLRYCRPHVTNPSNVKTIQTVFRVIFVKEYNLKGL